MQCFRLTENNPAKCSISYSKYALQFFHSHLKWPYTDNVLLNITVQYFIICLWVRSSNVLSDKRDRIYTASIIAHSYCFELILCIMFLPRRLNIITEYFILIMGQDE